MDFGYPWWLTYGHAVVLIPALALLILAWKRKWPRWVLALAGVLTIWSAVSLAIMQSLRATSVPVLPSAGFLRSGTGRVLDIGAGTGRSAIMVLRARPQATLVASDLFGDSFDRHFGHEGSPQARLKANLEAAGVAGRATIETADMRKLPYAPESFDAIVSAYAMDHVGREGARQSLAEAHRVLKPGGDFLLMLVGNDGWMKFAFGPMLTHGGTRGAAWWTASAQEAGFRVLEQGASPGTLHLLLNR